MALKKTEICYLLAFPDPVIKTAIPQVRISGLKDAPYFQPVDIRVHALEPTQVEAGGAVVHVTRQRYEETIQIVECRFVLPEALNLAGIQRRQAIEKALVAQFVPAEHRQSGLFEEYLILLLQQGRPAPDIYLDRNAVPLARFIRSQREVFDQDQLREILSSRVRYSNVDLTLVDWEGAVIIAPNGDFQSDIELLKIGNYQLLRYRMLDRRVEQILDDVNRAFFLNRKRPRATRGAVRSLVEHRLEVMLDFERTDQNLLLIGDWYTAKLYTAIRDEFYLEEWKNGIHTKLDNLEGIVQTIQANFALSFESLMDRVQLIGWVLLLIGYIYLYLLDAGWIRINLP